MPNTNDSGKGVAVGVSDGTPVGVMVTVNVGVISSVGVGVGVRVIVGVEVGSGVWLFATVAEGTKVGVRVGKRATVGSETVSTGAESHATSNTLATIHKNIKRQYGAIRCKILQLALKFKQMALHILLKSLRFSECESYVSLAYYCSS